MAMEEVLDVAIGVATPIADLFPQGVFEHLIAVSWTTANHDGTLLAFGVPTDAGAMASEVASIARSKGLELDQTVSSAEKSVIKKRIHALKAHREDAVSRKAYDELTRIRRGIRSLKRRTRQLALDAREATKVAALATPAPAGEGSTPEAAVEPASDS